MAFVVVHAIVVSRVVGVVPKSTSGTNGGGLSAPSAAGAVGYGGRRGEGIAPDTAVFSVRIGIEVIVLGDVVVPAMPSAGRGHGSARKGRKSWRKAVCVAALV